MDDRDKKLAGVHIDLCRVVLRAGTFVSFRIIEGVRTPERQRQLFAAGKSKTLNSRHITGHAVDIVPVVDGHISWDWKHFFPIAHVMGECARDMNIPLEWGGSWKRADSPDYLKLSKTFPDGAHFQLPWKEYP